MTDAKDYRKIISSKNTFSHFILAATLKEVRLINDKKLANQIERILSKNKIDKPRLHLSPNDPTTEYYKIDLKPDEIEKIVDLFLELEVQNIGQNGETTATCSFYASLADQWSALNS